MIETIVVAAFFGAWLLVSPKSLLIAGFVGLVLTGLWFGWGTFKLKDERQAKLDEIAFNQCITKNWFAIQKAYEEGRKFTGCQK